MNLENDIKSTPQWYAVKAFYNRITDVERQFDKNSAEIYIPPTDIIRTLLFFRSTQKYANEMQRALRGNALIYSRKEDNIWKPAPIPDNEMQLFRLVVSSGEDGLEFYENDDKVFSKGDHVRITGGPFKGAEGHIRRIKGNRRLIVSIKGFCAIATSYIPQCFIEKI